MASWLSNFVNNLADGFHNIKCEYRHDNKNYEMVKLNTNIMSAVLNTQALKNILIVYKCVCCHKIYQKNFDENKFILKLWKPIWIHKWLGKI